MKVSDTIASLALTIITGASIVLAKNWYKLHRDAQEEKWRKFISKEVVREVCVINNQMRANLIRQTQRQESVTARGNRGRNQPRSVRFSDNISTQRQMPPPTYSAAVRGSEGIITIEG